MDASHQAPLDLIFFGSGAFGLPCLRAIAQRHTVRAVVSQPDRPAGRGSQVTPTPIAEFALQHLPHIPVIKPQDVNAPEIAAQIQSYRPFAAVVIAFGQKLSPAVLPPEVPGPVPSRAINLHASLLPRWRGAAPINAAILAGDTMTGNTVITIAPRMDAGLVLAQSSLRIDPLATAGELHDQLAEQGPDLVLDVLARMQRGTLIGTTQDEALVTKARKLHKKDGFIDFAQGAEACRRKVHGLTPWPGVTVTFRNEPLKVLRVQVVPRSHNAAPGTLIDAAEGLVACGGGEGSSGRAPGDCLRLLEVQPSGGKKMAWAPFANGRRPPLTDREMLGGGAPS